MFRRPGVAFAFFIDSYLDLAHLVPLASEAKKYAKEEANWMKSVIVAEVLFVVRGPAKGHSGSMTVAVEGIEPKDQAMAHALAHVLCVWLNAAGRRS